MWEWSRTPGLCHSALASGLILPLNSGPIPPQGTAKGSRRRGTWGERPVVGWGSWAAQIFRLTLLPLPISLTGAAGEAPGAFVFLSLPNYSRKLSVHGLQQTFPFRNPVWYPVIPKQIHPSRAARSPLPRGRFLPPRPR